MAHSIGITAVIHPCTVFGYFLCLATTAATRSLQTSPLSVAPCPSNGKFFMECPKCSSSQLQKNGSRHGRQQYRCKDCKRQFTTASAPRGYSDDARQICVRMHRQGLSLREIEHLTGISRGTIHNWVRQVPQKEQHKHKRELSALLPTLH